MIPALTLFQDATFVLPDGTRQAQEAQWNAHPVFRGVWLKHLVLGKDTGGLLSCHLVRVEAGCEIGGHVHEGSVELHEVLCGRGACKVEGCETAYTPGVCLVVPMGATHRVAAFDADMHLLAKFAPALL